MGQRQQQLEIQKKQIKLQEDQFKLEQEQNAMLGASMKNMLLSMEQQPVATPQGLQDILGLPPQLQALTPLGQIVAETPAAAIPEFAKRTEKERAQLKVDRTIEQALGAISDPEIKNEFRAFTHLNAAGIDVPKDMLANVFPTLAQHMGGLDPQVANSALRYAMTGEFSWGQIRSLLSIPSVPGISDDLKFPPMLVKGGKATELQMKSQMFLTQMQSARKTLDNLHDRGVTINIGGQLQREVRVRAGSGGIFGLAPALADMALNLGLDRKSVV